MQQSKGIESKHFIDRVTGKTYRRYTFKGKPCVRVELKSKIVDQLAGYTLIEKDLRSVRIWLEEIEKLHTDGPKRSSESYHSSTDRERYNIVKGLFVAALTFYGKCFSKCDGRPVKLERVQLDPKFADLHDTCISYRHNFAAHSGAMRLEHVEVAAVFPQRPRPDSPIQIFRELHQPDLFWPRAPNITLVELVDHVKEISDRKISQLTSKVAQLELGKVVASHGRTK
jgi:hypothetical protein